ncbi:DUF3566 domain-containing protein [Gordonia soli]|uniref:DUF3566 domain-containing protein n=1 Tax=Gordonia soli TaxID=320799 RepID=UPI0003457633|nr:DUF3566 domain-containing protein [Gordonia soli]
MSTPNEPDNEKSGNEAPESAAPGPSGPGAGRLVPPWQRGPGDGGPKSTAPTGDSSSTTSHGGPPPRGVVSGTAAASITGQQAPVTKLDNPGGGGTATVTEDDPDGKFVESPTRNIDREDLPGQQLPNLDAIHHVDAAPTAGPGAAAPAPGPRSAPAQVGNAGQALRAAVQIRRIDPWATFKISAVLSVAGFFIWMIAVAVLYLILDGMGVWDQLNSSFSTIVTSDGSAGEGDVIGAGTVFGWSVLLGAINAILLTAFATIGSYIYNLCADLIGGAEVTLADLD